MSTDDIKKQKLEKWVKWGLVGVAAFVVSPIIFMTIKGLIGLAIAGVVGLAIVNFAPVIAFKFANWKVKGIMHEAGVNPIPTLINQVREKYEALVRYKDSITSFRTEVSNFEEKVKKFTKEYPEEGPKFAEQLEKMKRLLLYRVDKYKGAKKETELFEVAVEKARALWDMSQEAIRMNKLAGMETGDPFEKIKTEIALDSVMSSVNQAFSELDTALMDDDASKQLAETHVTKLEYKAPNVLTQNIDIPDAEFVPITMNDVAPVTARARR